MKTKYPPYPAATMAGYHFLVVTSLYSLIKVAWNALIGLLLYDMEKFPPIEDECTPLKPSGLGIKFW